MRQRSKIYWFALILAFAGQTAMAASKKNPTKASCEKLLTSQSELDFAFAVQALAGPDIKELVNRITSGQIHFSSERWKSLLLLDSKLKESKLIYSIATFQDQLNPIDVVEMKILASHSEHRLTYSHRDFESDLKRIKFKDLSMGSFTVIMTEAVGRSEVSETIKSLKVPEDKMIEFLISFLAQDSEFDELANPTLAADPTQWPMRRGKPATSKNYKNNLRRLISTGPFDQLNIRRVENRAKLAMVACYFFPDIAREALLRAPKDEDAKTTQTEWKEAMAALDRPSYLKSLAWLLAKGGDGERELKLVLDLPAPALSHTDLLTFWVNILSDQIGDGWSLESVSSRSLYSYKGYEILSLKDRREILIRFLNQIPASTFSGPAYGRNNRLTSMENFFTQWLNVRPLSMAAATAGLTATLMAKAPDYIVESTLGLQLGDLMKLHLLSEDGKPGLQEELRSFAKQYPSLLPPTIVETFWDKALDVAIVRKFFRYYTTHLPRRHGDEATVASSFIPETSLQLMCEIVGWQKNCAAIKQSKIYDNPGTFYSILFDLQSRFNDPIFADVEFEPTAFDSKEHLFDFLNSLRNILNLHLSSRRDSDSGDDESTIGSTMSTADWKNFLVRQGIDRSISDKNIESLTQKINQEILAKVNGIFTDTDTDNASQKKSKSRAGGPSVVLTTENLQKLLNEWGNLESITTLVSRLSGSKSATWNREIPVLKEVFQQSVMGTFAQYKFESAEAKNQLEGLSKKQVDAWKENRYLLTKASGGTQDQSDLRDNFAKIVATNLIPHSEAVKAHDANPGMPFSDSLGLDSLLSEIQAQVNQGDPAKLISKIMTDQSPKLNDKETSLLLARLFKNVVAKLGKVDAVEAAELRTLARIGLGLVQQQQLEVEASDRTQLQSDFKSLIKIFMTELAVARKSSLIFSVLSSDPVLMLTIGDLVDTTSCQNYRTGGMIQTLLGYVIDANVRALASFEIGMGQFANQNDFHQLYQALSQGVPVNTEWNGNNRTAVFSWSDAGARQSVSTHPLGHAYLRQIVRIGNTVDEDGSTKIGTLLEREYLQNNSELASMRENHQAIFAQLNSELGAYNHGTITFRETRNPGGVYSDAGRGIQNREFCVEVSSDK